jgi:cysteine synthase
MNPLAHFETTAEELLSQVDNITHFVAGVGTGGTISGIGKKLKQHNSNIQIILINFDEWPGIEGLKHIGEGHYIPDTFDQSIVDSVIHVDIEKAAAISKLLAYKGLFIGQSSGAYITAAIEICRKHQNNNRVVTILNDIGERYFSTGIWG